jgi:hypothetical protein
MSGRVRLLDNKQLLAQLQNLERRTGRGKDVIDHPANSHDDIANSCAGAIVLAMGAAGGVLGLIAFEQLEAAGKLGTLETPAWDKDFLFQFEAKVRGLEPQSTPQWTPEPLRGCPTCSATIVTKLSAKEFRCQECAAQWTEGAPAKPVRGQRGEFLAGRLPRARQFKFPVQGPGGHR